MQIYFEYLVFTLLPLRPKLIEKSIYLFISNIYIYIYIYIYQFYKLIYVILIYISNIHTHVFHKQRFFSTESRCCLTFSWIELQMLLRCCLIHISCLRHIIKVLFIFTVFVSMSRPSSVYVVSMWSFSLFLSSFSLKWID